MIRGNMAVKEMRLPERGAGEGREYELSGSSKEAWDGSGAEEACEGGTPHGKHYDPRKYGGKRDVAP